MNQYKDCINTSINEYDRITGVGYTVKMTRLPRFFRIKNTICSNIKQAIISRIFFIGSLGIMVTIFLASIQNIVEAFRQDEPLMNNFHFSIVVSALTSDAIVMAIPIICTLPYAASFIDDIKTGYIKSYLHRTATMSYLIGKAFACAISGGLVIVTGILLSLGVSALIFTPMETAGMGGEVIRPLVFGLVKQLPLLFFTGAFLSVVGMTVSAVTGSRYMAYASPFVLYYILIILNERYMDSLYVLYPKEWLNPINAWGFGRLGVVLFLAELTLITALLFIIAGERGIENV